MDRADYAHWNSADVARLLALLESERRYYQEIVAGIPVGLLVVTSDLRIVSANAAVRRIFNLRSADPIRGSLDLLLPHGILDGVVEVLRTGRPQFAHRVTTRPELGGRHLRISIRPMTGWDLDNPREALITLEDLTGVAPIAEMAAAAQAAAEQAAARAEEAAEMAGAAADAAEAAAQPAEPVVVIETFETEVSAPQEGMPPERELINHLDAAVWACELPEMRFIFVSEGAVRILGYSAEQWEAPNFWRERIDAEDRERVLSEYREALESTGHFSGEFHARTADGRGVTIHESARVVDGGDGTRYLVGFSVDVTGRRHAETTRITRERLDALKTLSARLSHDLNNLLMIVTGYTEDALAGVGKGTAAHSGLTAIRTAGERLATIAAQLRAFATYAPATPALIELNELLSRISFDDSRVKMQPAAGPVWVHADGPELEQAIRGAVIRALAALPDEGEVSLSISTADRSASIEIRDTAAAMTAGERTGFFEQLLGGRQPSEESIAALSRAWFAVESWGGHITAEPVEGGNLVRITLPAAEAPRAPEPEPEPEPQAAATSETAAPEAAVEEPAAEPEAKPGPKTILVVEDEAGIRALVRKILERHGYAVLDAGTAEEALSQVETSSIDLIITDLVMPDMNGQQLVARLKQLRPDVRVLFISGYTDDMSMYSREFGNGTAFLQKPFTLGALVGKVREVLGVENA